MTAANSKSGKYGNVKKVPNDWKPPPLDRLEVEFAKKQHLPAITYEQQTAVCEWLYRLGFSILDGEGGYYRTENRNAHLHSTAPPLPLSQDRTRNGELVCDLVAALEPHAASHVHLHRYIHRSPRTLKAAQENNERALWIFRIRRSPPLPFFYLCQPDEMIKGTRNVLWGFLWELMQSYPMANEALERAEDFFERDLQHDNIFGDVPSREINRLFMKSKHKTSSEVIGNKWWLRLPYSSKQRRSLDTSIVQWLQTSNILTDFGITSDGSNDINPKTILELEGPIRDGSLLCLVTESLLGLPVKVWNKRPTTYAQCVSNISKATCSLRRCSSMSGRYLHTGVEEEIVRGNWDCVLGLLEDIRRCIDKEEPRIPVPTEEVWKQEGKDGPYLGPPAGTFYGTNRYDTFKTVPRKPLNFAQLKLQATGGLEANQTFEIDSLAGSAIKRRYNDDNFISDDAYYNTGDIIPTKKEDEWAYVKGENIEPDPMKVSGGIGSPGSLLSPKRAVLPPSIVAAQTARDIANIIKGIDGEGLKEDDHDDDPMWVKAATPVKGLENRYGLPPSSPFDQTIDLTPDSFDDLHNHLVHALDGSLIDNDHNSMSNEGIRNLAGLIQKRHKYNSAIIKAWLMKLDLLRSNQPLPDLSDGTFLCELVQKLERLHSIPGIIKNPKTYAHKVFNIRSAIETIASKNKKIPLHSLACEDDILAKNEDAYLKLLIAIRKGYKYYTR